MNQVTLKYMIIQKVDTFPVDILQHADRKITQECLDFYRSNPPNILVLTATDEDNNLIGATAAYYYENTWINSITVVHREHRNKGIGASLMERKIREQYRVNRNSSPRITIASDNFASLQMALKSGYKIERATKHTRRDGKPYLRMELVYEF